MVEFNSASLLRVHAAFGYLALYTGSRVVATTLHAAWSFPSVFLFLSDARSVWHGVPSEFGAGPFRDLLSEFR